MRDIDDWIMTVVMAIFAIFMLSASAAMIMFIITMVSELVQP